MDNSNDNIIPFGKPKKEELVEDTNAGVFVNPPLIGLFIEDNTILLTSEEAAKLAMILLSAVKIVMQPKETP